LPLNNKVPPELAEYQSIVSPVAGVAEIVTVPVPHLCPSVPVGAVGPEFTVAVTAVLPEETQPWLYFLPEHNTW
jgi:hypothetical protein